MSAEITALIERARLGAQSAPARDTGGSDREALTRVAAEFESMLLGQVLKDMRRAGSWHEDGDADTLGAESLFEALDVELALHLARTKGLGLGRQLEEAFDRLQPARTTSPSPLTTSDSSRLPHSPARLEVPVGNAGVDRHTPRELPEKPRNAVTAALKAAADAGLAAPKAVTQLVKPVAGAVTSAFGWRHDPFTQQLKFHQGIDLRAAYGQEVHAAAAGRVVFSGNQGGYGATVVVQHEDGTRTRYAHLSARLVEKGAAVAAGEPLGRAGRSGRATGTHLHFEVIAPDGRRIQPDGWARVHQAPVTDAAGQVGNPAPVAASRSAKVDRADAD